MRRPHLLLTLGIPLGLLLLHHVLHEFLRVNAHLPGHLLHLGVEPLLLRLWLLPLLGTTTHRGLTLRGLTLTTTPTLRPGRASLL